MFQLFLRYPPLRFTKKNSAPDKWGAPETFRNTRYFQKDRKGPPTSFFVLWDKEFSTFSDDTLLRITEAFASERWAASILICSQLVLVSLNKLSSGRIATSVVHFFPFENLRKSRKLRVADLLAFCIMRICWVTAGRWPQQRMHQIFKTLVLRFLKP